MCWFSFIWFTIMAEVTRALSKTCGKLSQSYNNSAEYALNKKRVVSTKFYIWRGNHWCARGEHWAECYGENLDKAIFVYNNLMRY